MVYVVKFYQPVNGYKMFRKFDRYSDYGAMREACAHWRKVYGAGMCEVLPE